MADDYDIGDLSDADLAAAGEDGYFRRENSGGYTLSGVLDTLTNTAGGVLSLIQSNKDAKDAKKRTPAASWTQFLPLIIVGVVLLAVLGFVFRKP